MKKKNVLITDEKLDIFQIDTDKVLKEYCKINIEHTKGRIDMLNKQINKMKKDDIALTIASELLKKSQKELNLYVDELRFLESKES